MSVAMSQYQERLSLFLHQRGPLNDLLTVGEKKLGVERIYIAYGILSFVVLWLAVGCGAQLPANLIGFLYPAYCTIKAMESGTKKEDIQWMTYWLIFASLSVVEFFRNLVVRWIPFYWLTKSAFLIWCMAPNENNGSAMIYNYLIRPLFPKSHTRVQSIVDKANKNVGELFETAARDHVTVH